MAARRRSSNHAVSRSVTAWRVPSNGIAARTAPSSSRCERTTSPSGHARTAPSAKYVSVPSGRQAGARPANGSPSGPAFVETWILPPSGLEEPASAGIRVRDPSRCRRRPPAGRPARGRSGTRPSWAHPPAAASRQLDRLELAVLVRVVERPAELVGKRGRLLRRLLDRRRRGSCPARSRPPAASLLAAQRVEARGERDRRDDEHDQRRSSPPHATRIRLNLSRRAGGGAAAGGRRWRRRRAGRRRWR